MSLISFNEKHKQFLDNVYERINKKFDTDRGKEIADCIIQMSEPFLFEYSVKKLLVDLIIKDLDLICENDNVKTIDGFKRLAMWYTKEICIGMSLPLF